MSDPVSDDRQVIPRWRYYKDTLRTGELVNPRAQRREAVTFNQSDIDEKVSRFEVEGSIENAKDVLEAALISDVGSVANRAARVLDGASGLPPAVRRCVQYVISGDEEASRPLVEQSIAPLDDARVIVRTLKNRLTEFPTAAYIWVDLARAYSVLGHNDKAERALFVARAIAPRDRFVLRSSARFEIHMDRPDKAVWLMHQHHDLIRVDPWLAAAEIAAVSVAEQGQKRIKLARQMLSDQRYSPHDVSDLSSAIATLELESGANKAARRFFQLSLQSPNDNSLAQARWGSRRLSGFVVPEFAAGVPFAFEARMINAVENHKWPNVLQHCREWMLDEPYSAHPAAGGSFYAMVALDNPGEGEKFARIGLQSNPGHLTLANNLAVALALQGRIGEARKAQDAARIGPSSDAERAMIIATHGLIEICDGNLKRGVAHYEAALGITSRARAVRTHVLILLHLADVLKGRDIGAAMQAYERAVDLFGKRSDSAVEAMIARLSTLHRTGKIQSLLKGVRKKFDI